MQHVHVVLRDEAPDVCDAVRSRNVVQVLLLSWGQHGVLRSRGQMDCECMEDKLSRHVSHSVVP